MSEEKNEDKLNLIYKWSSVHTAEARYEDFLTDYYWSAPVKKVLFKLKNTERTLIALVGLQGTGKSTALGALIESLGDEGIFFWKWNKEFMEVLREEADIDENWERVIYSELSHKPKEFIQKKLHIDSGVFRHLVTSLYKRGLQDRALQELERIISLEDAEQLVGKESIRKLQDDYIWKDFKQRRYLFVDLPDYKKSDAYSFAKDLDQLQHLWNRLMNEPGTKTTFLIAVQKEIVMKRPHFFLGKMDTVELTPLKPSELVDAYKLKWVTTEPFSEDGIKLLADLSRGVFRRFLKYIQASIESFINSGKNPPITATDVQSAISEDMLLMDMELELSDIFSKKTQKAQAVKILTTLRNGPLSQKEIASLINVSESTAGRFVSKLEAHKYVQRTRGDGKTWLISLT